MSGAAINKNPGIKKIMANETLLIFYSMYQFLLS
jgi:hypothetical protein